MRCFIGIDLGSTTTKAVVVDEHQNILGRGITNSRSNYDTAATIAKQEALVNGRFYLFRQALGTTNALDGALDEFHSAWLAAWRRLASAIGTRMGGSRLARTPIKVTAIMPDAIPFGFTAMPDFVSRTGWRHASTSARTASISSCRGP